MRRRKGARCTAFSSEDERASRAGPEEQVNMLRKMMLHVIYVLERRRVHIAHLAERRWKESMWKSMSSDDTRQKSPVVKSGWTSAALGGADAG